MKNLMEALFLRSARHIGNWLREKVETNFPLEDRTESDGQAMLPQKDIVLKLTSEEDILAIEDKRFPKKRKLLVEFFDQFNSDCEEPSFLEIRKNSRQNPVRRHDKQTLRPTATNT